MVATTIEELVKVFYVAVTTGSVATCLLLTILVFKDKDHKLILYEKFSSVIRFEILLLIMGFFLVFWFSVKIITTGGM